MDPALLTVWKLDPSVVGGIAGMAIAYAILWRRLQHDSALTNSLSQPIFFAAGLVALGVALASPLDFLADHVLLLAHMLQHLLLLLVAPVLLIAGLPDVALATIGELVFARLLRQISHPLTVFVLALGVMWGWHAPAIYEAALRAEPLHAAEHLCFLSSEILFWWPVLRPASCPWRLPDPLLIVYLFAAAVGSSMLAAVITFSSEPLYPTYGSGSPYVGYAASLGVSPLLDQQLAGLLMWVGGGLWYFGAAILVFARWFSQREDELRNVGASS